MDDAAVGFLVLEVDKPVFPGRRVDERALVRSVDRRLALREHDAVFVGTADTLRAEYGLPAGGNTTRRGENIIPAVALVELGALQRRVVGQLVAVDEVAKVVDDLRALGVQLEQGEHIFHVGPAVGPTVDEIDPAVVIPQRARVDEAAPALHEHRRAPRAARLDGRDEIDAEIGIGVIDPELAGVVADGRSPHALAGLRRAERLLGHKPRQRVRDERPVHQVARMQDGQTGHVAEARCRHPIVVPHPHDVGVGIIGVQDRIPVGAVAEVRRPGGRSERFGAQHRSERGHDLAQFVDHEPREGDTPLLGQMRDVFLAGMVEEVEGGRALRSDCLAIGDAARMEIDQRDVFRRGELLHRPGPGCE